MTQAQARDRRLVDVFADLHRLVRADMPNRGGAAIRAPTLAQLQVLAFVHAAGPRAQKHIAAHLRISTAAAGRRVDTLERVGLIQRRRDTRDRRIVWVSVTEAGRTVYRGGTQRQEDRLAALLGRLPPQTTAGLLRNIPAFLAAARATRG